MALTGFNPSTVRTSMNSVQKAYNDLLKSLGTDMQNQFINGMADKWACKNAQKFFTEGFKPAVDGLIKDSNKTFKSVIDAMNSGAKAWAAQTGSEWSSISFSQVDKSMNVSNIKENINGVRGVDAASANTVAAKLPTIANEAKSALTAAENAVKDCGFIGGTTASNLVASLRKIRTNIDNATQKITEQTKKAINQTVQDYSNLEKDVANAFHS